MKFLIPVVTALAASATAQSLTDILSSTPAISELNTLLQNFPDLVSTLASASNITILAPANFALTEFLTTPTGQQFASDPVFARSVLSYHVLQGTYSAEDLLAIESDEQGAFFARTLLTPRVSGGVYANVSGGQTVEAVPMVDDSQERMSNVTFFSGFVLNSTILPGLTDIEFDGGLIHVINPVLTLPAPIGETLSAANRQSLIGAVQATNLLPTLEGTGGLTLFAPTNQGFQNIGSATGDLLTEQLTEILLYHAVSGVNYLNTLEDGEVLETVQGGTLTVTVREVEGEVITFINGVRVVNSNFPVANGVVHGIDNVLNPSNTTALPPPGATAGERQFGEASAGTIFPFASGVSDPTSSIFSATGPGFTEPPPNTPTSLVESTAGSGGMMTMAGGNSTSGVASPTVSGPVQTSGSQSISIPVQTGAAAMARGMPELALAAAGVLAYAL